MTERSTTSAASDLTTGVWQLDPSSSTVEFEVPHFYGLMTVKGHFDRFQGTLEGSARPAVSLVVEAGSLDTGNRRRDEHLRSKDFFDVAAHPEVRFEADALGSDGEGLTARGVLTARGREVPVEARITATEKGEGQEIEAIASVDQRLLGMTWSPLGIARTPSRLIVRGRLIRPDGRA